MDGTPSPRASRRCGSSRLDYRVQLPRVPGVTTGCEGPILRSFSSRTSGGMPLKLPQPEQYKDTPNSNAVGSTRIIRPKELRRTALISAALSIAKTAYAYLGRCKDISRQQNRRFSAASGVDVIRIADRVFPIAVSAESSSPVHAIRNRQHDLAPPVSR